MQLCNVHSNEMNRYEIVTVVIPLCCCMKELNKGKKMSKGEELSLHNPMVIVIAEEQQKNYLK